LYDMGETHEISLQEIIEGKTGVSLENDLEASKRAYSQIVCNFDNWDCCYPRHIVAASNYIFSKLHIDQQRRWANRMVQGDIWLNLNLIDNGGELVEFQRRVRFIMDQIPANKFDLLPANLMVEWNGHPDAKMREEGRELARRVAALRANREPLAVTKPVITAETPAVPPAVPSPAPQFEINSVSPADPAGPVTSPTASPATTQAPKMTR
jgi:hypothetical protein